MRVTLDELGARRRIMRVKNGLQQAEDVAAEVRLTAVDVVHAVLLDVDRDFALALISSGARLSPSAVADLLGARAVRILGPKQTQAWLTRQFGSNFQPSSSPALAWWEIPFLTGLPTIAAWELTRRELVVAPTGDPNWIVRLRAEELARVTSAHVGKITPIARTVADTV